MDKLKNDSIWNKDFILLLFICLVVNIVFQMPNPILSKYASELGAIGGLLGLVTGVFSTAALFSRPFAGIATDRYNKKIILIISILGIAISMFLYPLVNSFITLLIIRIFHGLSFGFNTTVALTMTANALPKNKLTNGIAIYGLGTVAGMAIGPSAGIYLMNTYGFRTSFYSAGGLAVIAVACSLLVKPENLSNKPENRTFSFKNNFIALKASIPATIALAFSCISGAVNSFLVLYGDERGISNVGIFFTAYACTVFLIRPLIGALADKKPVQWFLYVFGGALIVSILILGFTSTILFIVIAGVFLVIGYGGSQPILQSMCIKSVEEQYRGAASSTYYVGLDLGNTFGPIMTGAIAVNSGYGKAFLFMAIPALLGIAIVFMYVRYQNRKTQSKKLIDSENLL